MLPNLPTKCAGGRPRGGAPPETQCGGAPPRRHNVLSRLMDRAGHLLRRRGFWIGPSFRKLLPEAPSGLSF
eukprot:2783828-Alexandrium_andersonii.AAC.1